MFKKEKKQPIKYRIGTEVVYANKIELNKVTGQTILYIDDLIVFIIPKEMSVQQTYEQCSVARSAQVLQYDIRKELKRLTEANVDNNSLHLLRKMQEYLDYLQGDLAYFPKTIHH